MEEMTTGLHLTRSPRAELLAALVADYLNEPVDDPFSEPIVFVPGAAMRRWLSQHIANSMPRSVCAGVRFATLASLEALVAADDSADDPWAPGRLVWQIMSLVAEGAPGLEPLIRNLDANSQRLANAERIADLFHRYIRYRPAMLAHWASDVPPDLGFDSWQVHLWRHLKSRIDSPDPALRRAQLVENISSGEILVPWPRVFLFAPRHLIPSDIELLTAISQQVRVDAHVVTPAPGTATELARRIGRRGAADLSLLTNAAVTERELPASVIEPTINVHVSHGPRRQVEVLREVLTGLFADDPTLEPRDVVVASPRIEALATHLAAAFPDASQMSAGRHPASELRLQVVEKSAADENQLYALLRQLLQLGNSRATASDLLSLCSNPFVAQRFRFSGQGLERLAELVAQSAISWGLNHANRKLHGLGDVRQGTWQVGLQRLLLGVALSEESLAHVGVVAGVDDVESTDVELLGSLSELVTRVSSVVADCAEPAPAAAWVSRFRSVLDLLVEVPHEQGWQLTQLWEAFEQIDRRSGQSTVHLRIPDALALLEAEFSGRRARPSYGNGSLVATSLHAVGQTPHKVVCVIGLDEQSFPRSTIADGDDALAANPQPWDPDPGIDDRQALLDALGAASDRLILVYQGHSSLTNEIYHPPAGVIDLIEAPGATVVSESLQAHSPAYFEGAPRSFDKGALAAAKALVGPRLPPWDPFAVESIPLPEQPQAVELDTLKQFVSHPARYFLKNRAQVTYISEDQPTRELPLELNGLQKWAIGQRMLTHVIAGHPMDTVLEHEWRRGDLPPGRLGERILNDIAARVHQIVRHRQDHIGEAQEHHVVDLSIGGVRLTGKVTCRGSITLACQYGQVSAKHLAESWLDALALGCHQGRPIGAVVIGGKKRHMLAGVAPKTAEALLTDLVELSAQGLQSVLPMPPRVAHTWVMARLSGRDPLSGWELGRSWQYDSDETWRKFYPTDRKPWDQKVAGEPWAQPGEPTALGSLAALVWSPIVRAEQ